VATQEKIMHPYSWPIGTVHFSELPPAFQSSLEPYITLEGYVDEAFEVYQTATEGPYIMYSTYKVRVIIETVTPTTFRVRLA
jgi:hypothetical protein